MRGLRFAATALCVLWFSLAAAFAFDAATVSQSERALEGFRADLDRISQEILTPTITTARMSEHRAALEDIRTRALAQSARLGDAIVELTEQIGLLGPTPADGQTEAQGLADQRASLKASLDSVQSIKSRLDVLSVEAEQLSGRISAIQRDQFFQRIFSRDRTILNPLLWYDTFNGLGVLSTRLGALFTSWWRDVSATANPVGLALIPVFIFGFIFLFRLARRWLTRWADMRGIMDRKPDDFSRVWRIVRGMITTFAVVFTLATSIVLALDLSGYMTPRFNIVLLALIGIGGGTALHYALAQRIAAPGLPDWRIVDLDEPAANRLPILVGLASLISFTDSRMVNVADALFLPLSYTIGQSAIAALAILVLLALIVLAVRNQDGLGAATAGRKIYYQWVTAAIPVLWVLIAGGFVALLLGYLALASYIAQKLFLTGVLVVFLFLLHHLSDAAVAASFDPESSVGRAMRRVTGLGERAIERLGLVSRTAIDVVLVVAGVPLLLALWTVTWVDVRGLLNTAALGVKIGEISISPGTVFMVLLILVSGITLTNIVTGWLDRRILAETRVDRGVQDSIRKGASYAGYILATGFALSAAGLDFSNIAIVAGALGVGIGFGLQSIANNFISGLILLAERPIRVGDWISLASGEGIVRRINVRATEIETFDACSIIVPNSNLITEPVKNWTHGDTMGRFTVAVSVAYDSDPDLVQRILLDAAREHPRVVSAPEPAVALVRFGQYGLDFELRAFVADALNAGGAASDIRFALLGLFREKNISIAHALAVVQGTPGGSGNERN